jgi:hypothetical protein
MKLLTFIISLAASLPLLSQVYTPPAAPTTQPQQPPTDQGPGQKNKESSSPLGQEIPMLDPSAETITVGGVTIPLGDNRLLKARFEKYLNQPAESDAEAKAYRETIAKILQTISPLRDKAPNLKEAFLLLPGASSYPGDANLCSSLAEAVYVALLAKKDGNQLKELNQSIETEKNAIIREADWAARNDRDNNLGNTQPAAGGNGGQGGGRANNAAAANPGAGTSSLKYKETLSRITEIEALKKTNIIRTEAQTIQTKTQYQVTMIQWFAQRRYEHVLMAARFYNQIWKDGDSTLRIDKNSDVSKLFAQSLGISPTIASLDSLSNEAIREVDKYIEAFNYLLAQNEVHSASQRLMEAYALGEYLGPVATLPIEKKRRVALYVRDLHELYGALQARDYVRGKTLSDQLKITAKDFPSSKVDSLISGYTLASDLAIEDAKAQLLARNSEKAEEKIKKAAEIWPTNPKLQEFRTLVSNSGAIVVARNDFDRLLSEGNYREIAKRQYEFAPAIQGDATREDAFKQIMQNLMVIEGALGKAGEFSRVGQNYSAWEQLADIREQFPDDPKLGRELELLAPKVADFTLALDKAHQFENRNPKQTGSALTWFLKARSIYPQSQQAEKGIQRILNDILPES